jgi:phosphate-selective porin
MHGEVRAVVAVHISERRPIYEAFLVEGKTWEDAVSRMGMEGEWVDGGMEIHATVSCHPRRHCTMPH